MDPFYERRFEEFKQADDDQSRSTYVEVLQP
jgi:hypothetical protein